MKHLKLVSILVGASLCLSLGQYFVTGIPGRLVFGPILFVLVGLYIVSDKGILK